MFPSLANFRATPDADPVKESLKFIDLLNLARADPGRYAKDTQMGLDLSRLKPQRPLARNEDRKSVV